MPDHSTVCGWVVERPDFANQYTRARTIGYDVLAEQILDIADTPAQGIKAKCDGDGILIEATTGDMIEHRRLQVDARKWLLSKMRPEKYGDRLAVNQTGEVTVIKRLIGVDVGEI